MKQAINQLVSILKAGQPVGGMFKGADKSTAVLYYYKDSTFYAGNTANGGPASMDEELTEDTLRARLEGHFNSISMEESVEDAAHINQLFNRLQAQAVREAEAIVPAPVVVYSPEWAKAIPDPTIPLMPREAYALLQLLDEISAEMYIEDEPHAYREAVKAMKKLYNGLPAHQQKDIEELALAEVLELE